MLGLGGSDCCSVLIWLLQGANGSHAPQWENNIIPGQKFTDPKTGISVTVPGKRNVSGYDE